MAVETYPFIGMMDQDSPDQVIPRGAHRSAYNGLFRGVQGNMRWENAPGTTLIPNSLLPGTGTNMTVGSRYDAVKQRIFFFNYNSVGNHGIYIYYTAGASAGTFQRLVQNGVNTTGDPLAFLPYPRIYGIDILYGDGQSGDLLFYVDSLKRPRKLNIDRLLAGTYTTIKNNYLKVIKAPPVNAPQVTYENDTTVSVNNLLNSLWQFAYTWIYDDYEESVVSTASIVPLPSFQFNPQQNIPVSQSARISCYFQTGDQNVKKIRVYGRQTTSTGTSGWLIIDNLIKSDLSISDNTVYRYLFFGGGNYTAADPAFTVLLQDYVPQTANDQALLDGTTISYGGITEGYNYLNANINITSATVGTPAYSTNSSLFFTSPSGGFNGAQPIYTFYLTGVGTNDGLGNPTSLNFPQAIFYVRAKSNGGDIGFSYSNASTSSIPTLLSAIQGAAVSSGWVISGTATNSFSAYYPTGTIDMEAAYGYGLASTPNSYNFDQFAFLPQCAYQWGVMYFDEDGRTNGAITNNAAQTTTPPYHAGITQIAQITLRVTSIPPSWAAYWRPVRTSNLTYNKWFQWVSNSAFANNLVATPQQYAYFGISNKDIYNQTIQATQNVVSYSFSPGDRIRITGRYNSDLVGLENLSLDYPVLGLVSNPIANGITLSGDYIQISYPTADIGPSFNFNGDSNHQNYQIILYSTKAQNITSQNVFYEFGQTFGIGNSGTPSAFHNGNIDANLFATTDGDVFYRKRVIPIAATYNVPQGSFTQGSPYGTMWWNPGGGGVPIVDNGIYAIRGSVNKVAGLTNTTYPTFADADYDILNESSSPLTVHLQYVLNVTDTTDPNGQFQAFIKIAAPGNIITVIPVLDLQTGLKVGVQNTYTIDATVSMPAGSKLWTVNFCQNQMFISPSPITVTFIRTTTMDVYDYSYSDIYSLITNANNRPVVQDTNALQTYFSTLFRYSEPYQLGTNINNTNRFYPNNFDEFDKSFGDIIRLRVRQREMRVFQKRRCGRVGIYQKFIKNNTNETSLIVSDTIITQNNIQYFEGEFGIGNQPRSLCSSGYADYFADPVKGYFCRLSLDGIIPISEIYKAQTFAGNQLPKYLTDHFYAFGGIADIMGVYNVLSDRDSEAIFNFQFGELAGNIDPIGGISISFNERMNSFQSFYNYWSDSIVCCENQLYSFFNGQLFIHNNTNQYSNFYGSQKQCSINPIYKDPILLKKNFLAVEQVANNPWVAPSIYTDTFSYDSVVQQSNIVQEDFTQLGSQWNAAFLNDINSIGGIVNGDGLAGGLISIVFQAPTPQNFTYLNSVGIVYSENKYNPR